MQEAVVAQLELEDPVVLVVAEQELQQEVQMV
jgi:hypothetical protein